MVENETKRMILPETEESPEALKITARKNCSNKIREGFEFDDWTLLLLEMAKIQIEAMKAGQCTARKHFIAIMKELEYHCGFRFTRIDPATYEDDPRRG
jgi:hypothetical protein